MKENSKHLGPRKMGIPKQQLTTYRCYNKEELLLIRESKYCRTRPDFLSKDFDNDDGLFSPDKLLQHTWKCEGVENRVRRKAASQTSAGSGGGGGSVSGNSTTANTPQDNDKQQVNIKTARLRKGSSTASNGMDFKPDFQKSALEATIRPNRGGLSQTATTSKQGTCEKSRIRRAGCERVRKSTEQRRSSNGGEEPLPEWMDEGPESAFDIIELMGFEEDLQSEKEVSKTEEEQHSSSSPETVLPSLPVTLATSRLKQWMGEGSTLEFKGHHSQQHQPSFSPYLSPSRSPQTQFAPPLGSNNNQVSASRSFINSTSPVFIPNHGNHAQQGVHPLQMRHPFFGSNGPGVIGVPPMPGYGLSHYQHHAQQQHVMPAHLPSSRSPQTHFPPPPPLVNSNNQISANRSFINSPIFIPNHGNHAQQGVHPLQMRHPFFGSNGPGGGMGMPPMPGYGLSHYQHHAQQQPVMPAHLPPSRSPQTHFPPPPPLVNSNNHQISASRSNHFNQNYNLLNSPAFMPTSVMRQMSKVHGGAAISSTGCSETGSSTPNPTFSSGHSNIPPALEKIFASVRNQQTPDRSMLVRAILGQGNAPDDPSFSCSR